jgi:hypothetical protein
LHLHDLACTIIGGESTSQQKEKHMLGERLSDMLRAFLAEVVKLEIPVKKAILAALYTAIQPIKDAFRVLADGTKIPQSTVSLGAVHDVVPSFLRGDVKDLDRSIAREMQRRGQSWAAEGAPAAVAGMLIDPLRDHIAAIENPVAAPGAPSPTLQAHNDLAARVAALETATPVARVAALETATPVLSPAV